MRVQLFVAALTVALIAANGTGADASSFLDDALRYVYRCRSSDLHECVERDLARTVDAVMARNDTYRLNRYLTAAVAVAARATGGDGTAAVARSDGLAPRIVDLFNALRIRYQPEEPTAEDVFEGRKKKKDKKHKMGLMMASGAMAMSVIGGMLMKMKMHFVLLIAIKALIIAKLALLLAGAVALKKLLGSGGGGSGGGGVSVQPVWSTGGGSEHGGYRRSYGQTDDGVDRSMSEAAGSMAYGEQLRSSYDNHPQSP